MMSMKPVGLICQNEIALAPVTMSADHFYTDKATDFFTACHQCFQQALDHADRIYKRQYRIGGSTLQLIFAGDTLLSRVTPALAHLATTATAMPDLVVGLWGGLSGGTVIPPHWTQDDYVARGEIRGCQNERVQLAYQPASGVLSLFDASRKLALHWVREPACYPYYEQSSPLRSLLHWWFSRQDKQLVHAAAVGTAAGSVLLAGKGGSGKSTTAVRALAAGLFYLGDDYVLCGSEQGIPTVYSLYSSAKVDGDTLRRLSPLPVQAVNPQQLETEKALLLLQPHYPRQLLAAAPIRAILLPAVTGGQQTVLLPAKPMAALTALAPTTLFQLPAAGPQTLRYLSRLVQQLPCYHLHLGADSSQVVAVIADLL